MKFFMLLCLIVPGMAMADIASTKYVNNAENITDGTVNVKRLPVGSENATVAAGDDKRFDTVSIGQPDTMAQEKRALIWIE